ncbi:MAG: hypothetical protein WAX25_02450 [Minisyncoccia bacterium]
MFENTLDKGQSKLLYIVISIIVIICGVATFRTNVFDPLHIAFAHTISEGNFPMVDPTSPDHPFAYHYGSDLLTAGMYKIAGGPLLWLAFNLQIVFFLFGILLILFTIAYDFSKNFYKALICSVFFVFVSGLQFLNLFLEGFPVLYQKFFLNTEVVAQWKFVASAVFPPLNTSYVFGMHNHSLAMGMPLLLLVLYLYFKFHHSLDYSNKGNLVVAVFSGLFFGLSALSVETYFGVFAIAFILLFLKQAVIDKRLNFYIIVILFVGFFTAFLQGGVLTHIFDSSDGSTKLVFVKSLHDLINWNLSINQPGIIDPNSITRVFSLNFIIQFGLSIFLIIPALIHYRKNEKILFLGVIGLGAFFAPVLFHYTERPWEMTRFFTLALPFFAYVVGMYFVDLYDKGFPRWIIYLSSVFIIITGLFSQVMFMLTPLDNFGAISVPFVGGLMEPTQAKKDLYEWIDKNTTINDRFFPYNTDIMTYTGRFTPGYSLISFSSRNKDFENYNSILSSCSQQTLGILKITHIVVVSPEIEKFFSDRCDTKLFTKLYNDLENHYYVYKININLKK